MSVKIHKGKALVLRTCNADMTAHGGFVWPESGPVKAPDWRPTTDCGNGLHGALWGEGNGSLLNYSSDAVWQVVEIDEWIDLDGKVKFPRGVVVHTGDQKSATDYIRANGATGAVIGAHVASGDYGTSTSGRYGTSTSGDYGTSTSGDYGTSTSGRCGTSTSGYRGTSTSGTCGTSTSGYCGTAASGYRGTSTSGDYGTSTSGDYGTSTSGDYGTSTSGDYGTSTSGDYGTSTSGRYGTSTSGYRGTSTSGYRGASTSGDRGTSTSGRCGTSTSGEGGTLVIKHWDGSRCRLAVAYVGENGIKPNTPYRLNDKGEFVEVEQ